MKTTIRDLIISIETFFYCETKDSKVIPFILNKIQNSFVNKVIKYKKDNPGRPFRVIILKGRQFGFSTLIIAWFLCKCLLVQNTRAVVISHEGDATKKLFGKVKFFIKTFCLPATLDKESEKAYSFPKTNSSFYIGTAGSKTFGRGDNITDLHCSEVAFYENPGVVMNGLLQAVGMTGNVILETTANGVGSYFYKLWQKSYRNPQSAWLALFFKWTEFEEYEMDVPENFRRTSEENDICINHPEMTNRKLAWRRWKISETESEKGFTPEQIFMQEYPLTPQESFIHSGRAIFNINALESYKLKEPLRIEDADGLIGQIIIYKEPSAYSVAGIDSAEGKENNDRHVLDIYDEYLEQVVHLACWGDVDQFTYWCIKIMTAYKSFCVPEVNSATALMGYLKEGIYKDGNILIEKYPINMIYQREEFDKIYKEKKKRVIGWRTTAPSKDKLVNTLVQYVREHVIKINNPDTIDEMMSFVKNKIGRPEAIEGANDDRVIACGLALQGFIDRPPKIRLLTPEAIAEQETEKANKQWRKRRSLKIKKRKLKNRIYG